MKKLLLFILPMLLLFGVSFADTWTFPSNITYQTTNTANVSYGQSFMLSANMQLTSITKYSQSTCPFWFIRTGDVTNKYLTYSQSLPMYTGFVSGNIVTFNNAYLTAGVLYTIESGSGDNYLNAGVSCTHGYRYSFSDADKNNSRNTSGFFSRFNRVSRGAVQIFNSSTYWYDIVSFTFSGTYPTTTPITIRYNGTGMTFAGSNIYLDGLFHNYTMSGSDIIFTPYVYRALFRSH